MTDVIPINIRKDRVTIERILDELSSTTIATIKEMLIQKISYSLFKAALCSSLFSDL